MSDDKETTKQDPWADQMTPAQSYSSGRSSLVPALGSVPYDPTPIADKIPTRWLERKLTSGASVRVGRQDTHPHGVGFLHEMQHTQPHTGERTLLRFSLSREACEALFEIYIAHGMLDSPNLLTTHSSPLTTLSQ